MGSHVCESDGLGPDLLSRVRSWLVCCLPQVLLGLLAGTEKQFSSRGNAVTTQEPYNILPLSSSQIRYVCLCVCVCDEQLCMCDGWCVCMCDE